MQGVSTQKVTAITEQLYWVEHSSIQLSRVAAQIDEVHERWQTRPLGQTLYVYLDARYAKVRLDGQVRDAAVLIGMCLQADGKRMILDLSVSFANMTCTGASSSRCL